jgi:hypothetical protein
MWVVHMKVKENQASHIFGSYLEHNLESGDFYNFLIFNFQHLVINKHSPSKINLTFDKHFPGKQKRVPNYLFLPSGNFFFQKDQNLGIFSCQIYKLKKINPSYVS